MAKAARTMSAEQDVGGSLFEKQEYFTLSERRTSELVIGLVAPVGSGATTCAKILGKHLEDVYGYRVEYIGVSSLISEHVDEEISPTDPERIEKLQSAGNKIRQIAGNSALAMFAIDKINEGRASEDGRAPDRRFCTVIDSIKHPEEALILKEVYGDAFWLVGVFAPENVRINRLESDGKNKIYVEKIKGADYDEGLAYGQSVRKAMNHADVFFRNDKENTEGLKVSISRFVSMIFNSEIVTPNRDEMAMYDAAGVALGSACLSRQVGAVIANRNGEIIGRGANDVPKFGGGTYRSDDNSEDHRCFKWRSGECWNDHHKTKISNQITQAVGNQKSRKINEEKIAKTDLKNLIEFSRAVHAEMEAIISIARHGGVGIVGSTLYTTTFPCHNCARHIVASGIGSVLYIEPYPKSLALTLHSDSITISSEVTGKVKFLQFEGVAPGSFSRVFGSSVERKSGGRTVSVDKKSVRPVAAPALDSLDDRELMVIKQVLAKTGDVGDEHGIRPRATIPKISLAAANDIQPRR